MSEKIKEIKLLLQNDRRIWAVLGLCVVALVIWSFTSTPSKEKRARWTAPPSMLEGASEQGMGPIEAYNDIIQAFRDDISGLRKNSQEQSQVMNRLVSDLNEHKERSAGIFDSILDKMEEFGREIERIEDKTNGGLGNENLQAGRSGSISLEPDSLQSFGMEEATVPPPPPAPERPVRVSFISPGDSVQVELLTGVNAPVDGTPYPVVFRLASPITGPDGSTLELGNARIIAAAQGSETDGRVLYRLQDLAIRHSDGRRSVVKIDGWIVGEDGIRGMRGRLIDKLGRLIAATAGYSFAAALTERIDDKSGNIEVSDSDNIEIDTGDLKVGAASAITDASNRLGQILLDRYEQLVPVVEVLSGRTVAAVFSQPAEVTILEEDLEEGYYAASLD